MFSNRFPQVIHNGELICGKGIK